ncbi:glutathione binding-like protein, partial [Vibrio diazotrophicus]|uniref:glutathione binding-like protein n=1 Tax=Vibrio diazotrophicus TaxID=685 RepID=UPI0022B0258D
LSTPVENRDYLLTSGYSAADICVGQAVYMARHFATLDDFPETAAWFERLTERHSYQNALPGPDSGVLFDQPFYPAWEG